MAAEFWFLDRNRNRHGPITEEEIVRLIQEGAIKRETLLWSASMSDWRQASQVEGFTALFSRVPPPPPLAGPPGPPPAPFEIAASSSLPTGNLTCSIPVWGLFGRWLLVLIGAILIVPSPWTYVSFSKWLCERIMLPNGENFRFTGKAGDIWYVFIAMSAMIWIGRIPFAQLITLPLSWILGALVLKWFGAHVTSDDGRITLSFEGGYWAYFGWNLLLIVSFVTIIGWAWVARFMFRWMCRNVRGSLGFDFTGNGFSILWRSIVLALTCIFVIPIPWMIRWYMRWWISQVAVVQ